MRGNDVLATYRVIRLGMSVGRLPAILGDASAEMMRLPDTTVLAKPTLWLLTHVDMRRLTRMKIFNAFLVDSIRQAPAKSEAKAVGV